MYFVLHPRTESIICTGRDEQDLREGLPAMDLPHYLLIADAVGHLVGWFERLNDDQYHINFIKGGF